MFALALGLFRPRGAAGAGGARPRERLSGLGLDASGHLGDRAVRRPVRTGAEVQGPDGTPHLEILEGLDWTVELIDGGRSSLPSAAGAEGVPITIRRTAGEDAGGAQR